MLACQCVLHHAYEIVQYSPVMKFSLVAERQFNSLLPRSNYVERCYVQRFVFQLHAFRKECVFLHACMHASLQGRLGSALMK